MSNTIREKILQQILARLAVITIANGCQTGVGTNVVRARRSIDPDELPAAVLWPRPETAEEIYGRTRCAMPVRVEGLAAMGSGNASVISEKILGDLVKCLVSSAWVRSPEYITDIAYRGGGTETYPAEGETAVGTYADFIITYETKIGDPFSQ